MSFTREIFGRANIRGIADYLLYGYGLGEDNMNYERRLEEAFLKYEKIALQDDKKENTELIDSANEFSSETASVYTEIGLQVGFLIMQDMMKNVSFSNGIFGKESEGADYQAMYVSLFRDVTTALKLLQEDNNETLKTAVHILKTAQCRAKEIDINLANSTNKE